MVYVNLNPLTALTPSQFPMPLFTFNSPLNLSGTPFSAFALANSGDLPPGFSFQLSGNTIDLVNTSLNNPTAVSWASTASNPWNTSPSNTYWTGSNGSTYFQTNYKTTFPDVSSSAVTVTVDVGGVKPAAVYITSTSTAYTFTGGAIEGIRVVRARFQPGDSRREQFLYGRNLRFRRYAGRQRQ